MSGAGLGWTDYSGMAMKPLLVKTKHDFSPYKPWYTAYECNFDTDFHFKMDLLEHNPIVSDCV